MKKPTPSAPRHVAIHGDGRTPVQRVMRHPHEWDLVESDWNDETGVAVHTYERRVPALPAASVAEIGIPVVEVVTVTAAQPQGRRHDGWRWHDGSRTRGRQTDGTIRHY